MKVQTSSFDQSCKHWSCNVIWKSKPDLSFSKKLSRYQNSEKLLSLNVAALSNLYIYIRSLQVCHGLESFFFFAKLLLHWIADYYVYQDVRFTMFNIARARTLAILEK